MTTTQTQEPILLTQVEKLPPLPTVVHQVLQATDSDDSSATSVANVLRGDQAIVAKLLRVANSPFYGVQRKVSQVSRAVVILGSVAIRNLVIGVCARDALAVKGRHQETHLQLWRHSVGTAVASHLLAKRVGYEPAEEAFVGGLLHDIGRLAMAVFQEDTYRAAVAQCRPGVDQLEVERALFGCDHGQVGLRVLENWKLPKPLCCVVRNHHAQSFPPGGAYSTLTAVVGLADALVDCVGLGIEQHARQSLRAQADADLLKVTDADLAGIVSAMEARIRDAMDMFGMSNASPAEPLGCPGQRAIWVTPTDRPPNPLSVALLEWGGVTVRTVASTGMVDDLNEQDLILVDQQGQEPSQGRLADQLYQRGFPFVALLVDDAQGTNTPPPPEPGKAPRIARRFCTTDIQRLFQERAR